MTVQISTVKFLRHCAETSGGLKTARGQAFHRAAGHVVRIDEELQRIRARELEIAGGDDVITRTATNIYAMVRQDARDQGFAEPPTWDALPPEQHARFIRYAEAALGAPAYERPVDVEEMDTSAQG